MKRFDLIPLFLLSSLLAASVAKAQTLTSGPRPALEDIHPTEGFRLGLIKPVLELRTTPPKGMKSTYSDAKDTTGISVGYAKLPVAQLGWTAAGSYMEMRQDGDSLAMGRAEANLAYAFSNRFHAKGGLNVSKLTRNAPDALEPGVGLQASVGLMVYKNLGLEVGYGVMRQSASVATGKAEFEFSGFELAFTGTF